jgi:hypothetical protein
MNKRIGYFEKAARDEIKTHRCRTRSPAERAASSMERELDDGLEIFFFLLVSGSVCLYFLYRMEVPWFPTVALILAVFGIGFVSEMVLRAIIWRKVVELASHHRVIDPSSVPVEPHGFEEIDKHDGH